MNKKKVMVMMLAMLLLAQTLVVGAAGAVEMTVIEKMTQLEKMCYGSEQTGPLVERVKKLETDMYGTESKDALITKVDRMYSYVKESSITDPSFLIKMNGVEWTLTHGVTAQPIKTRIEAMERTLFGNSVSGAWDARLTKLLKTAYVDGKVDIAVVKAAKDSLIRVRMVTTHDTKTARAGDAVIFEAAEDIYADGYLVVAKGAHGTGKISKAVPAGNFGRNGELQIAFEGIEAVDGSPLELLLGDKAKEETKHVAMAAGASMAGLALLGPFGLIGGVFVQGENTTLKAGTEFYLQVKSDTELFGLKTTRQ